MKASVKKAKKDNMSVSSKKTKPTPRKRELTFAEKREQERIAETANMGPGAHSGHIKEFGSDVNHKMNFGGKYITKYDKGPGPGHFDTEAAMKHVKPKTYEAFINGEEKTSPFKSPTKSEAGPDPGAYHRG